MRLFEGIGEFGFVDYSRRGIPGDVLSNHLELGQLDKQVYGNNRFTCPGATLHYEDVLFPERGLPS